ncbi:hypothetical protein N7519_009674 [Penicillium mononematosum]|uniref:uncharacterized protein n=1 Tax=Penicillium mononematosum TaxID=268346 RepID=UPI002547FBF9|nr:uncharacterized protein N7519_009674 [Penicillium mononematosum]KAJ6179213.1 hypothetical protein N7519_009674 [Penicillium mononematosum]
MHEATMKDQHFELIEQDTMLVLREARLQTTLRSNRNAIHATQNELRPLLAFNDQQARYLNSKIEQLEALLEGLMTQRVQLGSDYDHIRSQRRYRRIHS